MRVDSLTLLAVLCGAVQANKYTLPYTGLINNGTAYRKSPTKSVGVPGKTFPRKKGVPQLVIHGSEMIHDVEIQRRDIANHPTQRLGCPICGCEQIGCCTCATATPSCTSAAGSVQAEGVPTVVPSTMITGHAITSTMMMVAPTTPVPAVSTTCFPVPQGKPVDNSEGTAGEQGKPGDNGEGTEGDNGVDTEGEQGKPGGNNGEGTEGEQGKPGDNNGEGTEQGKPDDNNGEGTEGEQGLPNTTATPPVQTNKPVASARPPVLVNAATKMTASGLGLGVMAALVSNML